MELDNYKIYVNSDLTVIEQRILVDIGFILGFYTISRSFPVTTVNSGKNTIKIVKNIGQEVAVHGSIIEVAVPEPDKYNDTLKEVAEIFQAETEITEREVVTPRGYESASQYAKEWKDRDFRQVRGLEALFDAGLFLNDMDNDLLPDSITAKILINASMTSKMLEAAINLAYRFGMEMTQAVLPFTTCPDDDTHQEHALIRFVTGAGFGVYLKRKNNCEFQSASNILEICGDGNLLVDKISRLCNNYPNLGEGADWQSFILRIINSFTMNDADGQLAYLNAFAKNDNVTCVFSPEYKEKRDLIEKIFPNAKFDNYKRRTIKREKTYDITWEVEDLKAIIREKLLPIVHLGDSVILQCAVSEDKKARDKLNDEICAELKNHGVSVDKCQIICSYKQGFSWINDFVIPDLRKLKKLQEITIYFKPMLASGSDEWNDESGIAPNYGNIYDNDPEKWRDIPIRNLQELYPIDDVISDALNIHRDCVKFEIYKGDENITYEVTALNENGEEIYQNSYLSRYYERPYIEEFPDMGKVHPASAYVCAMVNDKSVLNETFETDLTKIWNIYQRDILPEVGRVVMERSGGHPNPEQQPYFGCLNLKIKVSEPDYELPYRDDMITSIDAMHEDIYFVGADYFKMLGISVGVKPLDAPGLILPEIEKKEGKPEFSYALYDQVSDSPSIMGEDLNIMPQFKNGDIEIFIKSLSYSAAGRFNVVVEVIRKSDYVSFDMVDKFINSYAELLSAGVLETSEIFEDDASIDFYCENQLIAMANVGNRVQKTKDISICDVNLHIDEVISPAMFEEIIQSLKRVRGLKVIPLARSYQGRRIYGIQITPQRDGYISRVKLISKQPSEMINARHHANEVSSTNSTLMLIKELLSNPEYEEYRKNLNLIFIPLENVDGAQIHYELQKVNPLWKLHTARFSSIGKEFYYEYFNYETIHTEANAFTNAWWKSLPDVVVDNHGVPTHEWDQQYSGYASPSFKGFWLPRALLYSYFVIPDDSRFEWNIELNHHIADAVSEWVGKEPRIREGNIERIDRFQKYAAAWMPKMFQTKLEGNMINAWNPTSLNGTSNYLSIKVPWITAAAYVSEVTDETVHGDMLEFCASTHLLQDLGIIDLLNKSKAIFDKRLEVQNGQVVLSMKRLRPVIYNAGSVKKD